MVYEKQEYYSNRNKWHFAENKKATCVKNAVNFLFA
jgi:hypothetical protein